MFDKKLQSLLEEKTFMIEVLTSKALAMKAEIEGMTEAHNNEIDQAVKEAVETYENELSELKLSVDNLQQSLSTAEVDKANLIIENKRLNQVVKDLYGKLHDLYETEKIDTDKPEAEPVVDAKVDEADKDSEYDEEIIVRKMDHSILKKKTVFKELIPVSSFKYGVTTPNRGWYFYNTASSAYHWKFIMGYLKTIFPSVDAIVRASLVDKYSSFYAFSLIGIIKGETTNDVIVCEEHKDDAYVSVSENYKGQSRPFDRLMFYGKSIHKIVQATKDKFAQDPLEYSVSEFVRETDGPEVPDFLSLSAVIRNLV
jgi:molecular chaperone GrpE (heat shock protein)